MTIWLISDTHFGHDAMNLKFTRVNGVPARSHPWDNRRWRSSKETDEFMMDRWADVVQPGDHVYHLGDVTMKKMFLPLVRKLPGKKRLVRGNHDIFKTKEYLNVGFEEIHGVRVLGNMILTHVPIHPGSMGRFLGNVHGHLHGEASPVGRYLSACVEHLEYEPKPLEDFVMEFNRMPEAKMLHQPVTNVACRGCKEGLMVLRRGRNPEHGHFYGCSRFPNCTFTMEIAEAEHIRSIRRISHE